MYPGLYRPAVCHEQDEERCRSSVLGFSCFCFSRGRYIDLDLDRKSTMVMTSVMARNPSKFDDRNANPLDQKDNDESRGAYMDGSDCGRVAQDFRRVVG
jgi:hypothetical protein